MDSISSLDALSYLHGVEYVERKRQRIQKSVILKGVTLTPTNRVVNNAENNITIPAEEESRPVAEIHISLVVDFLNRIVFPTYVQKNWRHPMSEERDEEFQAKCLVLDKQSPGGKQYANSCKIWVVVLVCKGTAVCSASPDHGPTSPRRFCGYGLRLFARKGCPCTVVIEEFGNHTKEDDDLGWKMSPPLLERVTLSASAIADAYR